MGPSINNRVLPSYSTSDQNAFTAAAGPLERERLVCWAAVKRLAISINARVLPCGL
jgi:hypothetical protein